jgi:tRNA nucleotidyltransferase (CCA-adding enzyme)
MARRAHAYPQLTLTAVDLVDATVVSAPRAIGVADALRLAQRRHARVLACGARSHVLVEDLARAVTLGLGGLAATGLARPLPVVAPGTPEITVRRALADGAAAVVVAGHTPGVVSRRPAVRTRSLAGRVASGLPPAARDALDQVAALAAAHGARAFLAGGVVRDLWRGETGGARDLDVVIEGDGPGVARALADALGGSLLEHDRFLTASVESERVGRIDVVTARTERYERPGALPRVLPASIDQDLRRRDFGVNAMAVELASGAFGLLDPLGGVADLERRRLRILHPLSFVEDPTRMLRAARYAARLGLRADPWTRRCLAFALKLAPYPALSAARIAGELERLLAEPSASAALAVAVRAGVFKFADARWRATRATLDAVGALDATVRWAAAHRVAAPLTVAAIVLALEQPPDVATTLVPRLGLSGEPLLHVQRALAGAPRVADRVRRAARASETAAALRGEDGATLVVLRLAGDAATRERVDWFVREGRAVGSALHGDEVIGLGVPRGPAVSNVLRALRDARLDGRIVDREAEIRYVRALMRSDERKA